MRRQAVRRPRWWLLAQHWFQANAARVDEALECCLVIGGFGTLCYALLLAGGAS